MYIKKRKPYQNHSAQDDIETDIVQAKPKMEALNQLENLNKDTKNPQMTLYIKTQREELNALISDIMKKYGVSYADVIAKMEGEKLKNEIMERREKQQKRMETGKEEDIVDLVDESGILFARQKKGEEIPIHLKPFMQNYERQAKGLPALQISKDQKRAFLEGIGAEGLPVLPGREEGKEVRPERLMDLGGGEEEGKDELEEAYNSYGIPGVLYKVPKQHGKLPYAQHQHRLQQIRQQQQEARAKQEELQKMREEIQQRLGLQLQQRLGSALQKKVGIKKLGGVLKQAKQQRQQRQQLEKLAEIPLPPDEEEEEEEKQKKYQKYLKNKQEKQEKDLIKKTIIKSEKYTQKQKRNQKINQNPAILYEGANKLRDITKNYIEKNPNTALEMIHAKEEEEFQKKKEKDQKKIQKEKILQAKLQYSPKYKPKKTLEEYEEVKGEFFPKEGGNISEQSESTKITKQEEKKIQDIIDRFEIFINQKKPFKTQRDFLVNKIQQSYPNFQPKAIQKNALIDELRWYLKQVTL